VKLATLDDGTRDGSLLIVRRAGDRWTSAAHIANTLQEALDAWDDVEPALRALAGDLESGRVKRSEPCDPARLYAPLPRAYEWIDGSAYLSHIVLVRKARGAEPPKTLYTDPLVYQGGSGVMIGPRAPIDLIDASFGLDLEGEVAVVLGDTPLGTTRASAASHVRLLMLVNDVTYRNLVPAELEKGFGFFCSKPASAFSPFAITPDELGAAWQEGRVALPLYCSVNGRRIGEPDASAMHFSFYDLISHVAKTRAFTAGTILGGGTVSNEDERRGVACLAEQRTRETLSHGAPKTPFLQAGDRVRIEMLDPDGTSLFGCIEQQVRQR
jgi:fumarylacetoacetate (FAA) hydrolase